MRHLKVFILLLILPGVLSVSVEAGEKKSLYATMEEKEQFADEVSAMIGTAWKGWQDSVMINDVNVEGSRGLLSPGDIDEPVITSASIMKFLNKRGKSQDCIFCIKAVADAVENGMRLWQRGYTNNNIPFPLGASCVYTLPPCNNIPVTLSSGQSAGDRAMTEQALYNYMLYHAPVNDKDILIVFRGTARAVAECFERWKSSCSIIGILASGGIAPQPSPMGTGPGPVRGAKGYSGKLVGSYFDSTLMRSKMMEYFVEEKALGEE